MLCLAFSERCEQSIVARVSLIGWSAAPAVFDCGRRRARDMIRCSSNSLSVNGLRLIDAVRLDGRGQATAFPESHQCLSQRSSATCFRMGSAFSRSGCRTCARSASACGWRAGRATSRRSRAASPTSSSTCSSRARRRGAPRTSPRRSTPSAARWTRSPPRNTRATTSRCSTSTCRWPSRCWPTS